MDRMKYETYGCIREKRSKSLFLTPLLTDRTLSIIPTTHINFCEFDFCLIASRLGIVQTSLTLLSLFRDFCDFCVNLKLMFNVQSSMFNN